MLVKLRGGTVYDPANGVDGEVRDLYVRDGRIVAQPLDESVTQEFDLSGTVVMAGGIDLHTHIGGGKVSISRNMMVDDHRNHSFRRSPLRRSGCGHAAPSTFVTGYRYAQMGYTAAFEPAIVPINARQAHMEMADIPLVDTGGYALLGNDDFLLRLLADRTGQSAVNDYVAWILNATRCIGIKVVNPGGINAFKFNQRKLDLDESGPYYGVRPRDILASLTRALHDLKVPHPLHVHTSNLGVPGNFASTIETMDAAEGLPLHLTHVQFHCYGTEGDLHFSSAAARIAEELVRHPNITVDVGQIMFGQTVTASADTMAQYANRDHARPKKWMCMDIECEAGCGVVPFRYRDQNFVNALQWAIGLEVFLMVEDPWRIFLTTDHPNGAPFTTYPHLIRLLMDRTFRNDMLDRIHPGAAAASHLRSLNREYSLSEIAVITRAGPARILGLRDRGHLGEGAAADIAVYRKQADLEEMFTHPVYVFKNGQLVVRDGNIVDLAPGITHVVQPEFDRAIEGRLKKFFDDYLSVSMENFPIADAELDDVGMRVHTHPINDRR